MSVGPPAKTHATPKVAKAAQTQIASIIPILTAFEISTALYEIGRIVSAF